ncbi:MAG: ATP-binding protein [Ignavibacteria bacterium]|nr:ATP-binding protein [Ignavibacteria bacterium]
MKEESVSLIINSSVDYIHFVNDTAEILVKSKAKFKKDEDREKFIQDLRILIYELFSNAVSHSQSSNIILRYTLSSIELKIEIETTGEGFMIKSVDEFGNYAEKNAPPYNENILNSEFVVYRDDENIVLSRVTGKYSMELHHKKAENKNLIKKEVPEHYGLYLIACLSDKVTYNRTENGKDVFAIIKNIKGDDV